MVQAYNYFEEWLKTQQEFLAAWMDNAKKMQDAYASSISGDAGPLQAYLQSYIGCCKAFTSASSDTLKTGGDGAGVIRDAVSKAAQSQGIYLRMFEMWKPLWQAIQEKGLDASSYAKLLDPAKYRELMDRAFGFSPAGISAFYDQTQKNMDAAVTTTGRFMEPWMEALQRNMCMMPSFAQGHPSAVLNIFHNNFRAFDDTFGRILHIPPVGKDREKIELFLKSLDDIAVYMAKSIEYQHTMYVTGLRALEKLIQAVANKIKSSEIKSFDQIFELWIDINEKEYLDLGRTEAYSKLQGELMNAGLSVRRHNFKLMELYLYDVPVAVRSEMDDLYKTIYELKKKVKSLERHVKDLTGEEVAA